MYAQNNSLNFKDGDGIIDNDLGINKTIDSNVSEISIT